MTTYSGAGAGSFGALGGSITFEWIPDPEVVARSLFEAAGYLENMAPPLALSRQIAIDDMRERFATHSSPEGEAWQDWSASYEPDAMANNAGGILERTLELRGSATSPSAFYVSTDSVFFSTAGLPARWIWHQEGASRGSGGHSESEISGMMSTLGHTREQAVSALTAEGGGGGNVLPARPFVGTSFEAQLRIIEVFDQWFAGAVSIVTTSTGRLGRRHAVRGPGGRFVAREE